MAGREVGICLGLGYPIAAVLGLHPIRSASFLGTSVGCGPSPMAIVQRDSPGDPLVHAVVHSCHVQGWLWFVLAALVFGMASLLAIVLGVAVKRKPPQVVYVYGPPPTPPSTASS